MQTGLHYKNFYLMITKNYFKRIMLLKTKYIKLDFTKQKDLFFSQGHRLFKNSEVISIIFTNKIALILLKNPTFTV